MAHHLHIDNSSRGFALAHVRPHDVDAARERHAALCRDLEITVGWDGEALDERLRTATSLIASRPPRERLERRAPRLAWIQTTGAGIDHLLPLDWLPPRIVLTNNSGAHGQKCEEFCLMALVALATRLPHHVAAQRAHRWDPFHTPTIAGRTCVIVGFGDLGQGAARACRTLGVRVVAVTRGGTPHPLAERVLAQDRIDEAIPDADFVIVAAPLTPATRGILDRARLARLKPGTGLVNVARAALVDQTALGDLLRSGHLAGAVLDVHDPEPLPADAPVWDFPNTLVTPHTSCDDPRYPAMLLDAWFANFGRMLRGEPLLNVVDRSEGY